ncbi:MAG: LD-carboxypeptidase [Bacteroidales bacterium]|nr:LD-carboxypeptidase [Bacteroidales bacterium]HPD96429.1 LD-carboxypeptidase [Tenuifilaceae bacterium]HRX32548.1 LD-carboxypeptidase [Tenuifilaceae bacterium]
MTNITPPYLSHGDTIGLIATARAVVRDEIMQAVKYLTSKGFMVKTAPHLFSKQNQFAGTDEERAQDFMEMVEDPNVKAILCARGGYGTVRILDYINLRKLQLNPKWIIGYSDITVLHSIITTWYGVETLHAIMPISFPKDLTGDKSVQMLVDVLTGINPVYEVEPNSYNKKGSAQGILTGGNLSILVNLIGTDADFSAQGRILFIEDVDEYLYHIDRMMMQLRRTGKLKAISGLIVGTFTKMRDNEVPFGSDAYDIIHSATRDLKIPICFGFPAGHSEPNLPLIMGRQIKLDVTNEGSKVTFESELTAY